MAGGKKQYWGVEKVRGEYVGGLKGPYDSGEMNMFDVAVAVVGNKPGAEVIIVVDPCPSEDLEGDEALMILVIAAGIKIV